MKNRLITLAAVAALLAMPAVYGQDEKPKAKHNPMAADKDGDGFISKDEFMATASAKKDAEKAGKRFSQIDKDGDGKISADEMKAAAPKGKKDGEKKEKKAE
jgi:Ca2+-binding EF-hand superfamily protein